jgi:hypothetical protein
VLNVYFFVNYVINSFVINIKSPNVLRTTNPRELLGGRQIMQTEF